VTVSSYSTDDGEEDEDCNDDVDADLPMRQSSQTLATAFFSSRLTQMLRGW
jgi:hypothetical protein